MSINSIYQYLQITYNFAAIKHSALEVIFQHVSSTSTLVLK